MVAGGGDQVGDAAERFDGHAASVGVAGSGYLGGS
jgi:hypothetical protein